MVVPIKTFQMCVRNTTFNGFRLRYLRQYHQNSCNDSASPIARYENPPSKHDVIYLECCDEHHNYKYSSRINKIAIIIFNKKFPTDFFETLHNNVSSESRNERSAVSATSTQYSCCFLPSQCKHSIQGNSFCR